MFMASVSTVSSLSYFPPTPRNNLLPYSPPHDKHFPPKYSYPSHRQMSYDTPFHTPGAAGAAPKPIADLPMREQLKVGFKDMGSRSYSTAKNFGKVGLMFSGIECGIEGLRAKNDLANGAAAGCLTGGILARSGGPTAVAGGCAAFAAFSTAIDVWMRQPKED